MIWYGKFIKDIETYPIIKLYLSSGKFSLLHPHFTPEEKEEKINYNVEKNDI
jgi:hypothetical protein